MSNKTRRSPRLNALISGDPVRASGEFARSMLVRKAAVEKYGLQLDSDPVPSGFLTTAPLLEQESVTPGTLGMNPSEHFGAIVLRRPSMAEVEMGARRDDFIITPGTARQSPFHARGPESRTIMGHTSPQLTVTAEPIRTGLDPVLYGDVAGTVNKIADGATKLVSKVVNSDQWGKLSPTVKAALGVGAGLLGVKAISGLVPNLMMYRLGKNIGESGGDAEGAGVYAIAPATSSITRELVNSSVPVNYDAEIAATGQRWLPVSNDFFSGAYAIGKEFRSRKTRPNFGLLSSDPILATRALRGLRAPKLYVTGDGSILRTSAPYACAVPLDDLRRSAKMRSVAYPLAGGWLSEVAGTAMDAMGNALKDAGKTILSKIGEWAKSLVSKIAAQFKRWFTAGTKWPVKDYSVKITPAMVAARIWQLLGLLDEESVQVIENDIHSDVEALMKISDSKKQQEEANMRYPNILRRLENMRVTKGVPSNVPWTTVYSDKDKAPAEVLNQYAPRTAKHVYDLSTSGSDVLVDIFGTRNPPLLFADPDALKSDIQAAIDEFNAAHGIVTSSAKTGAGASAAPTLSAATMLGSSMQPQSATINTIGSAGSVGAAPSGGVGLTAQNVVITNPMGITDPDSLAAVLAANQGGTVSSVPAAWISQLPAQVQRSYYGKMYDVASPESIVGDPLSSRVADPQLRVRSMTRGASGSDPCAGFVPAIIAAGKFFLTYVLPLLLFAIPWDKVGAWFTKNSSKAAAIKAASKGSKKAMAASAAKSGGFLGAFSGAMKTIGRAAGSIGKGVLTAAVRHPVGAIAAALLCACFVMGSSYTKATQSKFADLVELLLRCIDELAQLGVIDSTQAAQHKAAMSAMMNRGGDLTEMEAQELQTVAILVAQSYLVATGEMGVSKDKLPAMSEFYECCQKASSDIQISSADSDMPALEEVCAAVIDSASEESESASTRGVTATVAPQGIDADAMAAIGAVGGTVLGAQKAMTPAQNSGELPANAAQALAGSDLVQEAESLSPSQNAGGATGGASDAAAESVLGHLDDAQLVELSSITDAAMSLSDAELDAEQSTGVGQVTEAISEMLRKWGLPVAAATGIAALVLSAVRARKRGATSGIGATVASAFDSVARWWSNVAEQHDANAPGYSGTSYYTEVAL